MKKAMKKWLPVLAVMAISQNALAADRGAVLTPAAGAEISLSASATRQIANDEAVIQLSMTRQGKTAKEAQAKLLADLSSGMKELKAALSGTNSEVQSGGLYTQANYAQRKAGEAAKIVSWTARESVTVTLKKTELAAQVIETSGQHFEFSGLQFQVSRDRQKEERGKLMTDVLEQLGAKAAVIADSMKLPAAEVKVQKIDFGDTGAVPVYRRMKTNQVMLASAAPMAAAPESFEAGESDVQLSASAVFVIGEKPAEK